MRWQDIHDEKEKYAAYLCSREWCEKREAVRARAKDKCERCHVLPMNACHHLTYKRRYNEQLEDLQAICNQCHEFTHGKSDFDPSKHFAWFRYLNICKSVSREPVPYDFVLSWGYRKDQAASAEMPLNRLMAIAEIHKRATDLFELSDDVGPMSETPENVLFHVARELVACAHQCGETLLYEFSRWAETNYTSCPLDEEHYDLCRKLIGI